MRINPFGSTRGLIFFEYFIIDMRAPSREALMKLAEIRKGLFVVVEGELATVTRVLEENQVEVRFQKDRRQKSVDIGSLVIIPPEAQEGDRYVDNDLISISENAPEEEVELARIRFETLSIFRSGEINHLEAKSRLGVSNGLFYKLLKLYDADVGVASLIRLRRGRKTGETRLGERVEEIIRLAIKKTYKGKACSYSKVWKEVESLCLENGEVIPSIGAVKVRVKKLGERELHKRKHGAESAHQMYDARPGKAKISAPLQVVQMDHTLVDLILVDEVSREPLGRPWLTVLVDLYTRVLLGYYLSLHYPSTLSVACAMTHAALPKNKYLDSLGVPLVAHPFFGLAKIVHMDNACEFRSPKFVRACALHGITPMWRPLGKKHYGGHVERLIGTLMTTEVHFLPGATFSNVVSRRGYDSEKKSALSFKEFARWFAGQVAIYHNTKHSSIGLSPKQAWDSYYRNEDGVVEYPPLISDPFSFKLDFMPEETRSINPWGISLFNKRYWSPALTPYIGKKKVHIKYDPLSMGTIWAKVDERYIAANFSDLTNGDFFYEEHRALLLGRCGEKKSRPGSLQDPDMVPVKRHGEKIVSEGVLTTKKARRVKAAVVEHASFEDINASAQPKELAKKQSKHVPDYSQKPVPFSRGKQ